MLELSLYNDIEKQETITRIADLFDFHKNLHQQLNTASEVDTNQAEETLIDWLNENNELYLIVKDEKTVGFVRIGYRGDNVAWIEDIYVDEKYRNKGIGTEAIKLSENIIKAKPGYTAICFDVVPRNINALKLYHKLGYDSLSILTVRKELYDNKNDRQISFLELDFKY